MVEGCPQWVGAEKCLLGAVWVLGNMIPFWFILKVCGLLRATADEEALGLDSSHHVTTPSLHPVPPNDPNITRLCQSVLPPLHMPCAGPHFGTATAEAAY